MCNLAKEMYQSDDITFYYRENDGDCKLYSMIVLDSNIYSSMQLLENPQIYGIHKINLFFAYDTVLKTYHMVPPDILADAAELETKCEIAATLIRSGRPKVLQDLIDTIISVDSNSDSPMSMVKPNLMLNILQFFITHKTSTLDNLPQNFIAAAQKKLKDNDDESVFQIKLNALALLVHHYTIEVEIEPRGKQLVERIITPIQEIVGDDVWSIMKYLLNKRELSTEEIYFEASCQYKECMDFVKVIPSVGESKFDSNASTAQKINAVCTKLEDMLVEFIDFSDSQSRNFTLNLMLHTLISSLRLACAEIIARDESKYKMSTGGYIAIMLRLCHAKLNQLLIEDPEQISLAYSILNASLNPDIRNLESTAKYLMHTINFKDANRQVVRAAVGINVCRATMRTDETVKNAIDVLEREEHFTLSNKIRLFVGENHEIKESLPIVQTIIAMPRNYISETLEEILKAVSTYLPFAEMGTLLKKVFNKLNKLIQDDKVYEILKEIKPAEVSKFFQDLGGVQNIVYLLYMNQPQIHDMAMRMVGMGGDIKPSYHLEYEKKRINLLFEEDQQMFQNDGEYFFILNSGNKMILVTGDADGYKRPITSIKVMNDESGTSKIYQILLDDTAKYDFQGGRQLESINLALYDGKVEVVIKRTLLEVDQYVSLKNPNNKFDTVTTYGIFNEVEFSELNMEVRRQKLLHAQLAQKLYESKTKSTQYVIVQPQVGIKLPTDEVYGSSDTENKTFKDVIWQGADITDQFVELYFREWPRVTPPFTYQSCAQFVLKADPTKWIPITQSEIDLFSCTSPCYERYFDPQLETVIHNETKLAELELSGLHMYHYVQIGNNCFRPKLSLYETHGTFLAKITKETYFTSLKKIFNLSRYMLNIVLQCVLCIEDEEIMKKILFESLPEKSENPTYRSLPNMESFERKIKEIKVFAIPSLHIVQFSIVYVLLNTFVAIMDNESTLESVHALLDNGFAPKFMNEVAKQSVAFLELYRNVLNRFRSVVNEPGGSQTSSSTESNPT